MRLNIMFIKSVVMLLLSLTTIACKKEQKQEELSSDTFKCEVNGVQYKDKMPILLPPGATRFPWFGYYYLNDRENYKYLIFQSFPRLENVSSDVAARYYNLEIYCPLDAELQVNKEYLFEAIPGEDYLMPVNYEIKYRDKQKAYSSISANGDLNNNCFGTGKMVIKSIDTDKMEVRGILELLIPSPIVAENKKLLTIKGEFRTTLNKNY